MSQQKVDAHKKEKQGKKALVAKQKKRRKITRIVAVIVALALIAGIVALIVYNNTKKDADLAEDAAIESVEDVDYSDLIDTGVDDTAEETTETAE